MDSNQRIGTLDAETAVIGSVLIDPRAYDVMADMLTPDAFQLELCRVIFQAAKDLAAEGTPVDPVAIGKRVRENGGQVSNQTLAELMEITPTAANAEYYARLVLEGAKRRSLRDLAEKILGDSTTPTDELISNTAGEISSLVESAVGSRCITSGDMLHRFYDDLANREAGKKNVLPSGFPNLDKVLGGGFLRGGLYIIAARPGMGKTTVALNLADNFPGGVLFVSLEMTAEQLTSKRLARETGIPSNRLLMGQNLTDAEYQKICAASSKLAESGLVVNRRMGATVAEIAVMARSVQNLSAVVVDYLGLVRGEGNTRYEQTTQVSGALKRLAISLNVPVIALAQLNRAAETRTDKRPSLADLRDSGAVEQDADGALLLYRADYYQQDRPAQSTWTPSLIECEVAKNRHAATGKTYFDGYLAVSKIAEARVQ